MKFKPLLQLYYPALLILLTFLGFTLYAYLEASSYYKVRRAKQFEQRAHRVAEVISNRMIDYAQILRGCQALFDASGSVSISEWSVYIKSLNVGKNYPGIQGMAVSRYVALQDSQVFQTEVRRVIPDYKLTSTFQQPMLAPVTFIQPLDSRNKRAVGFDLYSEVNRRDAIRRAIASGEPSITRKIRLKQETDHNVQPGFLMFLPVYSDPKHSKVTGFVANVFRTHDLMDSLLSHFSELDIQVYDGKVASDENVIFQKLSAKRPYDSRLRNNLDGEYVITVGGLPWRIKVTANSTFGSTIEKQQPYLILSSGLILSMLLFSVSYNNIRRRIRLAQELENAKILEVKKDEFISIASHELKTPLTSIKASVQMLERSDLKDRDRQMLGKARNNIEKLQNLIGDLLDISKIQAGQLNLNLDTYLLSDLINDCVENAGNLYGSHKIVVLEEIPELYLYCDKFRLEQALNNLLINAIKYSPSADQVFISVKITKEAIKIGVIDEGTGITKQNLKKIFDRFFRAEEISPVISGLGIGLHIANEIVRRHSGTIEVKSEVNEGSVFTIVLPLSMVRE